LLFVICYLLFVICCLFCLFVVCFVCFGGWVNFLDFHYITAALSSTATLL
jgi:hypothetical protein